MLHTNKIIIKLILYFIILYIQLIHVLQHIEHRYVFELDTNKFVYRNMLLFPNYIGH